MRVFARWLIGPSETLMILRPTNTHVFARNSSTTETQSTQRVHREDRCRDSLCKTVWGVLGTLILLFMQGCTTPAVETDLLTWGSRPRLYANACFAG